MTPHVLQAPRLPALYRDIFRYAGLPLPPGEEFVLRCGEQPPGLFAALLEEAFLEDESEAVVWQGDAPPDYRHAGPASVVIRAGFEAPCPLARELGEAVLPEGGPVLLFAVERRDAGGRLLGLTWAAVPEEEPGPREVFRAAVARVTSPPGRESR